jgi:methionyl aminopeptidase
MSCLNSKEIKIMAKAGEIAARAMEEVAKKIKVGETTSYLDKVAENTIKRFGAESSFKKVAGYKHTTCMTPNDVVVHGIPGGYVLAEGDILGVDLGVFYRGFHADTSWTFPVGNIDKEKEMFLSVGQKTLLKALEQVKIGNKIGDLSHVIQTNIEGAGYSVVRELVGHGIGTELHEEPPIPGRGKKGTGPLIREGMALAVEVIYNFGKPAVVFLPDGWSIATRDGSLSGLFEHTVVATKNGPYVLTRLGT